MSVLLYWLAIRAYALFLQIAALFHPKAKLFVEGRKGLLARIRYALIDERRPRIWMHCASLGEFEQGRPLLEKLRKQHPGFAIVITFFSPSGYEVRKNYAGADYIFYLPVDSAYAAKRFFKYVQPQFCIFVKYELWYFMLAEAVKKDIPVLLISAAFRQRQTFFKWYGRLHRRMLRFFTHIFVQDEISRQLLERINIETVTVSGDTRFDRVIENFDHKESLPVAEAFCGNNKILIAGSTWPEDEQLLQKAIHELPKEWKMIIAPHEVHDAHIRDIEKLFDGQTIRWSAWDGGNDKRILIVDTIGHLSQLYRYGHIAWIGGALGTTGLHNILEAAVFGIPSMFGPHTDKFREAQELIHAGGGYTIADHTTLVQQIRYWDKEPADYERAGKAAAQYIRNNSGATRKILAYLAEKNVLSTS